MKISIITGSRADRNALEMVRRALDQSHEVDVLVISSRKTAASPNDAAHAAAMAADRTRWRLVDVCAPADIVFLHGDRHEVLGAAVAANVMGVPIAHIGGGDITEGSQDDCFRHAITKLSHLHFASNQDSADRIIQMGERVERVHVTGCPGLDMVAQTPVLTRDETFAAVGLKSCDRLILVSFHPNTLGDTQAELEALSAALDRRGEPIVLIGPNADAGSDLIRAEWERLVEKNLPRSTPIGERITSRVVVWDNLPAQVFYSLMAHCDVMVGNSSAGYYEAPFFGTPVIDIGDRQKGRTRPENVVTVGTDGVAADVLSSTIFNMITGPFTLRHGIGPYRVKTSKFYGDGHAAERIAKVISDVDDPKKLLRKQFNDLTEFIPRPVLEMIPY